MGETFAWVIACLLAINAALGVAAVWYGAAQKTYAPREAALRKDFENFMLFCTVSKATWTLDLQGRDEVLTVRCTIDEDPNVAARILLSSQTLKDAS